MDLDCIWISRNISWDFGFVLCNDVIAYGFGSNNGMAEEVVVALAKKPHVPTANQTNQVLAVLAPFHLVHLATLGTTMVGVVKEIVFEQLVQRLPSLLLKPT